jgi:sec-independent protein translocase protein TatA
MPGGHELLIIAIVIVFIFGASRLPQIGDALGRSIRAFKRSVKGENEIEVNGQVKPKSLDGSKDD